MVSKQCRMAAARQGQVAGKSWAVGARAAFGERGTHPAPYIIIIGSLGSTVPSQQYRVRVRTEKSILGGLACLLSRRLSNLASLACTPFLIHRKFHLDRITIEYLSCRR